MKFASRSPYSATLALSRVDRWIGRSYSLFLLVSLIETLGTVAKQLPVLNLAVAIPAVSIFALALFYNVFNFWFGDGNIHSYVIIGVVMFCLLASMPFQPAVGSTWPEFQHSWVWWTTGGASVSMGLLLPRWWSWLYMALTPIAWFFLVQTTWGGSFGLAKALEDAAYVTLFPATIVGMAQLLRSAALRVDIAVEDAAAAAAERARIDAVERERSSIDALVHDSVLTTFLLSAKATSPEQMVLAKTSAQDALIKLKAAQADDSGEAISISSFAKALAESVRRQDANIEIDVTGGSAHLIKAEVASALSDATAQALTNSQQHAPFMSDRLFRLKISDREIKIVVRDDGPGFRPGRIPKNRLGLRVSIIERVEAVGGRVFIETSPGEGTTIVLEWEFA